VLLSAAVLWRGTGLDPVWGLTWVAPVPVLAFGLRASSPAAAAAALAAWVGGGLNLWSYYRTTVGVPLPVALAMVTLPAIAFAAEAPVTSVLAEVRVGRGGTPYSELGDWIAWLAGGLFTLALVTAARAASAREV
jgi:hypothetical protein